LSSYWVKSVRVWTIIGWIFLTIGIVLGGQWAYVELGWGGYWAWDPVENASLLPWFTLTAFIHSAIMYEKLKKLKIWTYFLAILSFELAILGTFITRSGVIDSVHSFGKSALGAFFMWFMAVTTLAFLVLLFKKYKELKETQSYSLISKEGLFFAVKTPEGVRLTRDGAFTMNDEGKLVTKQGYEVLPSDYEKSKEGISFATTDSIIKVDKNGQILTNIPNTATFTQNKKLLIVQPENLKDLVKEGDNLYKLADISSLKSIEQSGAVKQGFIEKSNVNAVKMMTQLIETNRLVGMYQKAMDTQMNDMNRDAIEKLAKKA